MRKLNNVVAWTALFFSLAGTSIAASHYIITSRSQIKPNVLRKLKARGPEGPPGPTGASGPIGPPGPSNLSALTIVRAGPTFVAPETVGSTVATCPAGQHSVAGGGTSGIAGIATSLMDSAHQSWFLIVVNRDSISQEIEAVAYCAGAGTAVAASAGHTAHARAVAEAKKIAAKLQRQLMATPRRR